MKKEIFYGKIENGEIKIPRSKALKDAMLSFGEKGFQITVERKVKRRSLSQNSYYWKICVPFVLDGLVDVGYPRSELSSEVVHDMLKDKFLRQQLVSEHGEALEIIKDSKSLSTTDFMSYIADIQRWAQEFLSIIIPDPGEQSMMNFE